MRNVTRATIPTTAVSLLAAGLPPEARHIRRKTQKKLLERSPRCTFGNQKRFRVVSEKRAAPSYRVVGRSFSAIPHRRPKRPETGPDGVRPATERELLRNARRRARGESKKKTLGLGGRYIGE